MSTQSGETAAFSGHSYSLGNHLCGAQSVLGFLSDIIYSSLLCGVQIHIYEVHKTHGTVFLKVKISKQNINLHVCSSLCVLGLLHYWFNFMFSSHRLRR